MNEEQIEILSLEGHHIGLHSHIHPYDIKDLSEKKQFNDYKKNKEIIKNITGKTPYAVAHPLGNYNKNTLSVLKTLNIKYGFRSDPFLKNCLNMTEPNFELPRIDGVEI